MANKRNYQHELDRLIGSLDPKSPRPSLLLHVCCAPCSSYVLEYLAGIFDITVHFYNPNITPESEYQKRIQELKRLIREAGYSGKVHFTEGISEPDAFFRMARGMEDLPERGQRCYHCYELRLEEAAMTARDMGADYFTTSLSISPHKNASWINEIGERMASRYGVRHLPSDFKKKSGYLRSIELSRQYDLYRQDYCGCVFSKKAAEKEGAARKAGTGQSS